MPFGDNCQTAIHGTIAGELQTFVVLRVDDGDGIGFGLEVLHRPSNLAVELLLFDELVKTVGVVVRLGWFDYRWRSFNNRLRRHALRLFVVHNLHIPLRVKKVILALLPDDAPVRRAILGVEEGYDLTDTLAVEWALLSEARPTEAAAIPVERRESGARVGR